MASAKAEFNWVCDVCHEESCTRCGSSLYHHGLSRKEDGVDTVRFQCESGEDDRIAEVDLKLMQIESEPMIRREQAVGQQLQEGDA